MVWYMSSSTTLLCQRDNEPLHFFPLNSQTKFYPALRCPMKTYTYHSLPNKMVSHFIELQVVNSIPYLTSLNICENLVFPQVHNSIKPLCPFTAICILYEQIRLQHQVSQCLAEASNSTSESIGHAQNVNAKG